MNSKLKIDIRLTSEESALGKFSKIEGLKVNLFSENVEKP